MLKIMEGYKTYIGIAAGLVYLGLIQFAGVENSEMVWGAIAAWTGVSLRSAISNGK